MGHSDKSRGQLHAGSLTTQSLPGVDRRALSSEERNLLCNRESGIEKRSPHGHRGPPHPALPDPELSRGCGRRKSRLRGQVPGTGEKYTHRSREPKGSLEEEDRSTRRGRHSNTHWNARGKQGRQEAGPPRKAVDSCVSYKQPRRGQRSWVHGRGAKGKDSTEISWASISDKHRCRSPQQNPGKLNTRTITIITHYDQVRLTLEMQKVQSAPISVIDHTNKRREKT